MMEQELTISKSNTTTQLAEKPNPVISFPFGLPGFEHLRSFNLKAVKGAKDFMLLQSTTEPEIALLVLNADCLDVYDKYPLPETELHKVAVNAEDQIARLVVVRFDKAKQQLKANLKAPIIINLKQKIGVQVILDNEELGTDYVLYLEN